MEKQLLEKHHRRQYANIWGALFSGGAECFLDNRCQGTGTCLIGSCQGSFLGLDQTSMEPTSGQALDLFLLDDGISDTGGLLRDAHLATWRHGDLPDGACHGREPGWTMCGWLEREGLPSCRGGKLFYAARCTRSLTGSMQLCSSSVGTSRTARHRTVFSAPWPQCGRLVSWLLGKMFAAIFTCKKKRTRLVSNVGLLSAAE